MRFIDEALGDPVTITPHGDRRRGRQDEAGFNLTVTAVNDPPVAAGR